MDISDDHFEKQLREIKNKINSYADYSEIEALIEYIINYTKPKLNEIDFFKKYDQIINVLTSTSAIKNQLYVEKLLKKYFINYLEYLKCDDYGGLAILFHKILRNKFFFFYPIIYKYILQLINFDEELYDILTFDNNKLFGLISSKISFFEDIVEFSSSYCLFFNSKLRNQMVLNLFDYYKKNKKLYIWFPFSGISLEPQLFSYIFHLLFELDSNKTFINNFSIICSDHSNFLLENGYKSTLFNELFLKIKDDFSKENNLKIGSIKTNLAKSKKNIEIKKVDFIVKNEIPDIDIDYVFINSLKLSNLTYEKERILKLLNKLYQSNQEIKVILEILSSYFIKEIDFNSSLPIKSKLICSEFYSQENKDFHILYFEIHFEKNKSQNEEIINLSKLYDYYQSGDIKKLKSVIKNNLNIVLNTNDEKIKYAEILSSVGYHSRSFEMVKKHYTIDYNKSYYILNDILTHSKNEKLIKSVELFIKLKKIREKRFSEDIFKAVKDEIDNFLKD
ncbi:MAG TPA: hypothetical protein PK771_01300 [Spirochaetota bacterium]|nr:hypothetical protein [Spirochaetota bacterium]